MKTIVYSLLLISSMAFSQREVPVSSFSKITAFDQIDVILVSTNEESKVILNGAGSESVEIVVKNSELKIRMPLLKLLKGDNVSATVFYNKDVVQFEANEGSQISSNDFFKSENLRFIAKEAGKIKLKIDAGKINVKVGSGAAVSLSGIAKNQEVVTNTGGIYEGSKLVTNQTVISSNAGGDASVNATELVDAKILAGGVITIYGDPKHITQKVTGGGRIEQVK
jgi:hypothetical protein